MITSKERIPGVPSTINARNVNEAFVLGVKAIQAHGVANDSRNGPVLKFPNLVVTCYQRPYERVLSHPVRHCNHTFHLMESLWMLAGRNDLKFLTEFNPRMAEYSDDGEFIRGSAYGYRWRKHFPIDQIEEAIKHLEKDPNSRRCVISHWDVTMDAFTETKDTPCNQQIFFWLEGKFLCMTVTNRSNDMIWGAYGSNAVHFSFLHEYMAMRLKKFIGVYNQVSNNMHVYTENDVWKRVRHIDPGPVDHYDMGELKVCLIDSNFDVDNKYFFDCYDSEIFPDQEKFKSRFFKEVVWRLYTAWKYWHGKDQPLDSLTHARNILYSPITPDFNDACIYEVDRKIKRKTQQ